MSETRIVKDPLEATKKRMLKQMDDVLRGFWIAWIIWGAPFVISFVVFIGAAISGVALPMRWLAFSISMTIGYSLTFGIWSGIKASKQGAHIIKLIYRANQEEKIPADNQILKLTPIGSFKGNPDGEIFVSHAKFTPDSALDEAYITSPAPFDALCSWSDSLGFYYASYIKIKQTILSAVELRVCDIGISTQLMEKITIPLLWINDSDWHAMKVQQRCFRIPSPSSNDVNKIAEVINLHEVGYWKNKYEHLEQKHTTLLNERLDVKGMAGDLMAEWVEGIKTGREIPKEPTKLQEIAPTVKKKLILILGVGIFCTIVGFVILRIAIGG